MKVAYLGTSDFAATILRRLAASSHEVVLVLTRPDRPAGRGRRLTAPAVAGAAQQLGLVLEQPDDVNSEQARARIAAAAPDLLVVCAFGALIREDLLAEHEILNVHPSLLPRWRGAAPIERAIMAGDEQTGVCIMRLTAGLDSGPVGIEATEPIRPDDDYGSLADRLAELGAAKLIAALDSPPAYAEQPDEGVTYAEKIGPADRTLDPDAPPAQQALVVRALHPHIGARIDLGEGQMLGVLRAAVAEDAPAGPPVLHARDGELYWGGLRLLEVQPAGKRPMAGADYARGNL